MQDITTEGITLVENLHKKREPLPFLEAIYVIKPTLETIKLVLNDLDSSPSIYKAYHIFFIESKLLMRVETI
jgi:syntaxin-binding protein 1